MIVCIQGVSASSHLMDNRWGGGWSGLVPLSHRCQAGGCWACWLYPTYRSWFKCNFDSQTLSLEPSCQKGFRIFQNFRLNCQRCCCWLECMVRNSVSHLPHAGFWNLKTLRSYCHQKGSREALSGSILAPSEMFHTFKTHFYWPSVSLMVCTLRYNKDPVRRYFSLWNLTRSGPSFLKWRDLETPITALFIDCNL